MYPLVMKNGRVFLTYYPFHSRFTFDLLARSDFPFLWTPWTGKGEILQDGE